MRDLVPAVGANAAATRAGGLGATHAPGAAPLATSASLPSTSSSTHGCFSFAQWYVQNQTHVSATLLLQPLDPFHCLGQLPAQADKRFAKLRQSEIPAGPPNAG